MTRSRRCCRINRRSRDEEEYSPGLLNSCFMLLGSPALFDRCRGGTASHRNGSCSPLRARSNRYAISACQRRLSSWDLRARVSSTPPLMHDGNNTVARPVPATKRRRIRARGMCDSQWSCSMHDSRKKSVNRTSPSRESVPRPSLSCRRGASASMRSALYRSRR